MYVQVIVAIFIAFGPERIPVRLGLEAEPVLALMLVLVAVALAPVPGFFLAGWVRRRLRSAVLSPAHVPVRWPLLGYRAFLLADFAAVIYLLNWSYFVNVTCRLDSVILVGELLTFAPFVLMLLLAWVPLYRVEVMLRHGAWSLRDYVEFNLRQYVLFILAPFLVLVVLVDVWDMYVSHAAQIWLLDSGAVYPIYGVLAVGFYVASPLLLRYVWLTETLPDGPLRRKLDELCRRARVGYSRILVWNTLGGQIVNACVSGSVRYLRYILLTDSLLLHLTTDEVTAVFGHEVGHVRRRHMLFYFMYVLAFLIVLMAPATERRISFLGTGTGGQVGEIVLGAALLVLYWGVLFGYISRRFEREADVEATQLTGNRFDFINALEKISALGNRPRRARSWRHFSIANRVQFLLDMAEDPLVPAAHERQVRVLKGLCVFLFLGAVLYLFL